jgi:L,D-transpeptidase YcbB
MRGYIHWHRFTVIVLCGLAAVGIIAACKDSSSASTFTKQQATVPAGYTLSPAGVSALHAIGDSARNPDLRWPDFTPYKSEFAKFYDSNGYSLAWVQNGHVSPQGLAVIGLLENANGKGLEPEDYDGPRWPDRVSKLSQNPSEQDLVTFDTALTVCAMRYVRAVHVGRVNPQEFKFQLDVDAQQINLGDFLQTKVVNASDPAAEIQKTEPPFLGYRKLLALLPVYEEMAKKDDGGKLQAVVKTVRPGQPYPDLARLGKLLQIIGDIPAGTQLDLNATIYDGAFVDGVKHYQDRHGESPTGNLDARTINELNTPGPARIRQIKLTLERWRWLPHSFSQPPVVVNLPEYRLRAMNPDGTVAFYKNVIIGKAYGHKSPAFSAAKSSHTFRRTQPISPSIISRWSLRKARW